MRIVIGQQYVAAGVDFPFSHIMQRWLGAQLTTIAAASDRDFSERYGPDYDLIIHISARKGTTSSDVKGPAIYKDDREIEYAIFLPFDAVTSCADAMEHLFDGIRQVLSREGFECGRLDVERHTMSRQICSQAEMLKVPWPTSGVHEP